MLISFKALKCDRTNSIARHPQGLLYILVCRHREKSNTEGEEDEINIETDPLMLIELLGNGL